MQKKWLYGLELAIWMFKAKRSLNSLFFFILEEYRITQALFKKLKLIPGSRCLVPKSVCLKQRNRKNEAFFNNESLWFHGIVQNINFEHGPVTVFIEDIGQK